MTTDYELPDPHDLLSMAEDEETRVNIDDYSEVIIKLKGKNWTYRDIAEWLTNKGVPVTHMQVYRFYQRYEKLTKELDEAHECGDESRVEQLEQKLWNIKSDEPDENE